MSAPVYIPIEGERLISQGPQSVISNYRFAQYDQGSRTTVSVPIHVIKEYKLTQRSAMFKIVNGIINVLGDMPRREELRGALALREFERLNAGDQRKLCEVCGVPFVHPDHPYNRWATTGYHRRFSKHFYQTYAWLKGEEVFTYWPDSFILTNYRLYAFDDKRDKLYMFPLYMVETFEARKSRLKIKATTGNFEIRGRVPRQDHLIQMWQARAWDVLPSEHLDWLCRTFTYINPRHPLSQYTYSDTSSVATQVAQETREEMQVTSAEAGAGTVFVKPVIKNRCEHCNAPMSWETIDWVGPDQYACPSCNNTHRVEYQRFAPS
ncbi:MAG: hypothetical protein AM324_008265 [Candidatus Thorarchaeota archaeon SMTZ1-83]|nr:MAG: hypothetical protein AM324_09600 [Candidatus Thorarchaeota archaeon SMTZ1-83]